jgi:hypothetical protein
MKLKSGRLSPCIEKLKTRRRKFPSDRERATGNQDALMFVADGEIWEMKRRAELEESVTPLSFDAWCLQYKGKAL